jgi:hypothetical protein
LKKHIGNLKDQLLGEGNNNQLQRTSSLTGNESAVSINASKSLKVVGSRVRQIKINTKNSFKLENRRKASTSRNGTSDRSATSGG